ncbi:molybdopterin-guanine dinucleotide biosynthesis protein B [Rhizobacter sp. Root1221]|uniref:molybdopterin-guanine dinucleotide biosynthesis protein B n=1 Tax=Rhizobacter sp. Root1221 TaxID=1736433 RepID=UPI0006FAFD7A|nr:molybdopterin-guanine dinucleotide biosynthesis protein B [Rhizobacter sp. Root1221]KQW00568.1 molybdopterin-guanine dinucleotide biosynthesis protein MobB [Rhizobacter sp. Root1221]
MKVIGFCGRSGSGKTTLIEQLIPALRAAGQRVSVLKHAHHDFDIDHPGKDSYRHRKAGAFETVVASSRRLAIVREYEVEVDTGVHQMLAELSVCDWALVEGFKHADLPKIEVWRAETGHPVQYPVDPYIVAIATDDPARLPERTGLPLLDLGDAPAVAAFLLSDPDRYEYTFPDFPPGAAAAG